MIPTRRPQLPVYRPEPLTAALNLDHPMMTGVVGVWASSPHRWVNELYPQDANTTDDSIQRLGARGPSRDLTLNQRIVSPKRSEYFTLNPSGWTRFFEFDADTTNNYVAMFRIGGVDGGMEIWGSNSTGSGNTRVCVARYTTGGKYRGMQGPNINRISAGDKNVRMIITAPDSSIQSFCECYLLRDGDEAIHFQLSTSVWTTNTGNMVEGSEDISWGSRPDAYTDLDGSLHRSVWWNRELTGTEAIKFLYDPDKYIYKTQDTGARSIWSGLVGGSFTETFTPSGVGTAALSKALSLSKAVTLGGTGTSSTPSFLKSLSKALAFTGTGAVTLAQTISDKILDYAAIGTVTLTRALAISKAFVYSAVGAPRLNKGGDLEGAVNPQDALPRDLPRIHEFIVNNGGPWAGSLQDDYRTALCVAVGYTEEQALAINISDAWALYAEDRNL